MELLQNREEVVRLLAERQARMDENPLRYSTRHVVQDAAMRDTRKVVGVIGGNWSGKSSLAAMICAGVASHTYPISGMYPDDPMRIWYISSPLVFFEVQPRMKLYIPKGFLVKTSTESAWNCDKYWEFNDGGYIRFISWDRDADSIEGPEIDLALFDEPPPANIQSKVLSRLRGKVKRAIYFFTPLGASSHLHGQFEGGDRMRVGLHKMAIWMNCMCLAGLAEEKLLRLHKRVELATEVHDLDCRCNGGYKLLKEIEDYLLQFGGLELEAREWGEWMFLHRRIFPIFDRDRHVLDLSWRLKNWRRRFPPDGSLYVVCDPHGSRPDFVQFWVALPNESHVLVAELPSFVDGEFKGKRFPDILNYYRPTSEVAQQIVSVIKSIDLPVRDMLIDPRAGRINVRDSEHKVVDSFNEALKAAGLTTSKFRTIVSTRDRVESIDDGHRRINDLLAHDNRITGLPFIQMVDECENSIWAYENYRRGEDSDDETKASNDKPEERVKDPIDDTRYYLMARPRFHPPTIILEKSVWNDTPNQVVSNTGMPELKYGNQMEVKRSIFPIGGL